MFCSLAYMSIRIYLITHIYNLRCRTSTSREVWMCDGLEKMQRRCLVPPHHRRATTTHADQLN